MLRLDTYDIGTGGSETTAMETPLTPRVIESLVSELRAADGCGAGFAIDKLCAALAGDQPRQARSQIDGLLDCGVSVEALFESYIPRAAARLGEMWVEDSMSFASVTLGMTRLTEIYRSLSPEFLRDRARCRHRRKALFALAPGETHALGVVMAADHFERAGWAVRVELQADSRMIARIAQANRFDLVGVSAGSRRMIPAVCETVARLRDAVGDTHVMVGGQLSSLEQDLAALTGADTVHGNLRLALADAEDALSVR